MKRFLDPSFKLTKGFQKIENKSFYSAISFPKISSKTAQNPSTKISEFPATEIKTAHKACSFTTNSVTFQPESGQEVHPDTSQKQQSSSASSPEKKKGKSSKAQNRVDAPSLAKEVSTMGFMQSQQSDMAASGKHADESDSQPGYWEDKPNSNTISRSSDSKGETETERVFSSLSGASDKGYS